MCILSNNILEDEEDNPSNPSHNPPKSIDTDLENSFSRRHKSDFVTNYRKIERSRSIQRVDFLVGDERFVFERLYG